MPYVGLEHIEPETMRLRGTGDSGALKGNVRIFEPESTLYARLRPYLNKVYAPDFTGVASPEFFVFQPTSSLARGFLSYLLSSPSIVEFANRNSEGIDRPRLAWARLAEYPVRLPPLAEQRRIVAVVEEHLWRLEEADRIVSTALARLKRFERALTGSLLTGSWDTRPLRELAITITKGTTPTSLGRSFTTDGVLFVKAESLTRGVIDHARCAHIDRETDELLARSRLADHDVLITIAGTLGRVALVRSRDLPANTNQAVCLVRLENPDLAPWLAMWLRSPRGQALIRTGGRGVGLQNLNLKQIGDVKAALPPGDKQPGIIAELEQQLSLIDALCTAIETARKRSTALRRAILEWAFRGELVPQDPDDEPASALLERIRAERAAPKATRRKRVPA